MKFVCFDDYRIGLVNDGTTYDVTTYLPDGDALWGPIRMVRFIEQFSTIRPRLQGDMEAGRLKAAQVRRLLPPITQPNKVIGAPVNYKVHLETYPGAEKYTTRASGVFLKAPSAIVGPADEIRLPADRTVNYEGELAFIVGKTATDVPAAEAMDYIWGYTGMLDLTLKGAEGRSTRKSFDTFAPTGPCLVTADEVPDPHDVQIRVWINDELRGDYNTKDMICRIPELIEYTSSMMTLLPGDVFATGNGGKPDAFHPGDTIRLDIAHIGSMTLPVKARQATGLVPATSAES